MPTIEELAQRLAALEQVEAARQAKRDQAIAAAAAARAAALAEAEQRAIDEAAARKQRRLAQEAAILRGPDPITVRLGGLARRSMFVDSKARVFDGVDVDDDGERWMALRGEKPALIGAARTLHAEAGEAGRRAAKAIYAGCCEVAPAVLATAAE